MNSSRMNPTCSLCGTALAGTAAKMVNGAPAHLECHAKLRKVPERARSRPNAAVSVRIDDDADAVRARDAAWKVARLQDAYADLQTEVTENIAADARLDAIDAAYDAIVKYRIVPDNSYAAYAEEDEGNDYSLYTEYGYTETDYTETDEEHDCGDRLS